MVRMFLRLRRATTKLITNRTAPLMLQKKKSASLPNLQTSALLIIAIDLFHMNF